MDGTSVEKFFTGTLGISGDRIAFVAMEEQRRKGYPIVQ